MNTERLEAAIALYEAEIFGDADPVKLDVLCTTVEAEADRIGYDNHRRLMALHTMAARNAEEEAQHALRAAIAAGGAS